MAREAATAGNTPLLQDAALLLLDQARIVEGEPITDAAAFTRRLSAFMGKGFG
jgi:molecular chaperone HtpG